ncbi:MAG: DUF5928 domain-containing protein [Pseudomonadota bacterium]
MAQIAFILLCHRDPEAVIAQARRLIATGDCVSIHYDANAAPEGFAQIEAALKSEAQVCFAKRRVRCGWGEWSLVEATLAAIETALEAFADASHLFMLSGDCMPIKSARYAHDLLAPCDRDFVESFNFYTSNWIKTGLKKERLIYRHWFNERRRKWAFYTSMAMQKRLRLERDVPADLDVMIGSQWWCLRRQSIEKILAFCAERPDVVRFFRTTWIPDETFFQTLVRHLVPSAEISSRSLTLKMFSDYGMPVNFYNDQYDFLLSQDFLFARKISGEAEDLKAKLGRLWDSDQAEFSISGDGQKLFSFLTGRGRIGRRFAPRFWERGATLGPDRTLIMLVCKKWHVAKRVLQACREELGVVGLEYVFDEAGCELPHLGGIERTLEKRNRHRRALMRMLFDHYGTERLVMCLDPNNLDVMRDFSSDQVETRVIEIRCKIDDDYLIGHAERVGLTGPQTPREVIERLLPTLRYEFAFESDQIRDAQLSTHLRVDEIAERCEAGEAMAQGLGVPPETGIRILSREHLFAD